MLGKDGGVLASETPRSANSGLFALSLLTRHTRDKDAFTAPCSSSHAFRCPLDSRLLGLVAVIRTSSSGSAFLPLSAAVDMHLAMMTPISFSRPFS